MVRRSHDVSLRQPLKSLPPPGAWNNPDKWLIHRGDIIYGVNPDAEKLVLPVDDRGIVLGREAVRMVRGLFKPSYIWEYDPNDPLTKPDVHHLYGTKESYEPEHFDGYALPKQFRNVPTNLIYGQRLFHNTFHATTELIPMPDMCVMEEYVANYKIAFGLFSRLLESARRAHDDRKLFSIRRDMVRNSEGLLPNGATDEIGEAILRTQFAKDFEAYSRALKEAGIILDYLSGRDERFAPHLEALMQCRKGLGVTLRNSPQLTLNKPTSIVSELLQEAA